MKPALPTIRIVQHKDGTWSLDTRLLSGLSHLGYSTQQRAEWAANGLAQAYLMGWRDREVALRQQLDIAALCDVSGACAPREVVPYREDEGEVA